MKIKPKILPLLLFIVVYGLSCMMLSLNGRGDIFHYNSLGYFFAKCVIVFLANIIATVLCRRIIDKATSALFYITIVISFIFAIYHYFITPDDIVYYKLLWLSTIHSAVMGVYLGVCLIKDIDFHTVSDKVIKGYSVLYFVSFIILFMRPFATGATTNFIIGGGTFSFIPYLFRKPYDWSVWQVLIGNCVFFIPISFILKALIPKIKDYQLIIIGTLLPFFIEGYQLLFKCGDVDIDDIVLNLSGFFIGLLLLKLQNKIKKEVI